MTDVIAIAREGRAWVIRHNDGVLGHAHGREEARRVARVLVEWIEDQGRAVTLRMPEDAPPGTGGA